MVAIGAATGNLFLVVAGLLLLGYAVTVSEQNQALQSWVDALGLNSVQEFVVIAILLGGIAMVAIGAAMGNILLVLAGLAIIWMAIAYTQSSGMMKSWTEEQVSKAAAFITAALILGGIALIATGAVIPANREFLAVLGDQKSGTNIEAPMSTIEEGVENVLRRNGWNGSGAAEIHLIVSAKSGIGKALKFEVDKETERQGVKLVGG